MEKAIVSINNKDYELKFTIGFWKKIKEICDVTSGNMQEKLESDFGNIGSQIIYQGCYFSNKENYPSIEEIEDNLDRSCIDAIETALINGMTKAERELVEIAKKRREKQIKELIGDDDTIDDVEVVEDVSEKK